MVVASKRAVGAEYGYQTPSRLPQSQRRVRVRVRRRISPMTGIAAGICLITLLFSVGLSYIYIKAFKAHLYYQISVSKQAVLDISAENEKLKLDLARSKELGRIEQIASQKLGMIKNPGVRYLVLQDRSSSGTAALAVNLAAAEEEGTKETSGKRILKQLAAVFSKGQKEGKG